MTYTYTPKGVCSQRIQVEVEDGIIRNVQVLGGCSGNLQGISSLIIGMPAREAIGRMKGIRCGMKNSSCPDQIAIALEKALEELQGQGTDEATAKAQEVLAQLADLKKQLEGMTGAPSPNDEDPAAGGDDKDAKITALETEETK